MELACLDLEGVLVPEIWIAFAERTGIDELRATTRDIPDYNVLMKQRLGLLDQHKLKIDDIQEVIATWSRCPGRSTSSTGCANASRSLSCRIHFMSFHSR